jgi:hypothetical protein
MKHRLRAVLLSLAALLAIGSFQALAATAASATPHFEGGPARFSFTGNATTIESGTASVTCQAVGGSAEFLPNELNGKLTLKGCSGKVSGIPIAHCTSSGAATGEIRTNELGDRLVYLSQAKHEVGMLFGAGEVTPFASFACGANNEVLKGSLLARISPVNTITAHFPIAAIGKGGVQELSQYEGEKGEKLSAQLELSPGGGPFKVADLNASGFELSSTLAQDLVG